jgi:hypothetical protein
MPSLLLVLSTHAAEPLAQFVNEYFWLLERCEMTAA